MYGIPGAAEPSAHGVYTPVPANYASLMNADFKRLLEIPVTTSDNFSRMKPQYVEMGGERSNTRYGWIRTKV